MTTLPLSDPASGAQPPATPRRISRTPTGGDAVFAHTFRVIGASVLAVTGGIGVFLAYQSVPTLRHYGLSFFTEHQWDIGHDVLGIAAVLSGTVLIALVALVIAFPLAVATAIYITEYAPPRMRSTLVAATDLMAAIPSVVYGLWGVFLVMPHAAFFSLFVQRTFLPLLLHGTARTIVILVMVVGLIAGLGMRFGMRITGRLLWIPFGIAAAAAVSLLPLLTVVDADPNAAVPDMTRYTKSAFIAGVVVAMMVMPMACSVIRQVFSQTPEGEKEGALALGATKSGMVRTVVLPFGRGGVIGGTMLALGRALGETMAVVMIVSPDFVIKGRIFEIGSQSVASLIASQFAEAQGIQVSALLTAGFVLFVLTLIVNTLAAIVVSRSRSGADTA
ncbi:PstC family ABC transporter permease [Nocardioides nematodiphilus]|uniref:PstC family ABC transporter permease n=1 Tax=Nocardioides nematodiphilus TaxID=2849669 RepID=UPI001CD9659A|nr:ABC transporter permease subunit [Nocardioides nematodiphilus]MCA1983036.1 ABC transporter permease subunit [Nocardioides nematodiphilus]